MIDVGTLLHCMVSTTLWSPQTYDIAEYFLGDSYDCTSRWQTTSSPWLPGCRTRTLMKPPSGSGSYIDGGLSCFGSSLFDLVDFRGLRLPIATH